MHLAVKGEHPDLDASCLRGDLMEAYWHPALGQGLDIDAELDKLAKRLASVQAQALAQAGSLTAVALGSGATSSHESAGELVLRPNRRDVDSRWRDGGMGPRDVDEIAIDSEPVILAQTAAADRATRTSALPRTTGWCNADAFPLTILLPRGASAFPCRLCRSAGSR